MILDKFKNIKMPELDYQTKKLLRIALIVLVAFISIILIVGLVKNGSKKLSDKQLKNTVIRAAKNYIADNKDEITDVYGTLKLDDTKLSSEGYMKPMTKLKGKNTSCKATALVYYNDKNFSYDVELKNCDSEYDYKTLSEVISSKDNVVSEGAGLYYDDVHDEYYYRGEYVDNYAKFAGSIWRILGVTNEGNVKIVQSKGTLKSMWDDRYNEDKLYETGKNDFEGVANSRIKDSIINEYNTNSVYSEDVKSVLVPTSYCVGKVKETDFSNIREKECMTKSELMPLGALVLSDFFRVSLDPKCNSIFSSSCANYNYISVLDSTWTLTAAEENSFKAYSINNDAGNSYANIERRVNLVAYISGDVLYDSGKGTEADPYVIK